MIPRKITKAINIGNCQIGGGAPILVQSMTKTDTTKVDETIAQIRELERAGCELVRVAVPDKAAARALRDIKRAIQIPLIADIHFDYRLGIMAAEQGADALRLNPGNIGSQRAWEAVVMAAKEYKISIRIGINAGSIEKGLASPNGKVTPAIMVESALKTIAILEKLDFYELKLSLKASDPWTTVQAYRLISQRVEYPLHIGVTEAGPLFSGLIKSSVALGILLSEGIGDTIRVSLSDHPVKEVRAGYSILRALGLRKKGIEIISCPTCSRCHIDIITLAEKMEEDLQGMDTPLKVAIMGCVVNGPGEAKDADVGIAGGRGGGLLFRNGQIIAKLPEEELYPALLAQIKSLSQENKPV
jgi:(E)-4-hydroxy-3-methylbut-2-enyl-diphosphate synthase